MNHKRGMSNCAFVAILVVITIVIVSGLALIISSSPNRSQRVLIWSGVVVAETSTNNTSFMVNAIQSNNPIYGLGSITNATQIVQLYDSNSGTDQSPTTASTTYYLVGASCKLSINQVVVVLSPPIHINGC